MTDRLCYLNGAYKPLSQAQVSVLDRGFLFGDGIYEVVPVYARKLFRFDEHMARLSRSLAKVRIGNPLSREDWLERCRKLVSALAEIEGADDQVVYIQVTRGVAPRDHVMPEGITPKDGYIRTLPGMLADKGGLDGFFIACFTRAQ